MKKIATLSIMLILFSFVQKEKSKIINKGIYVSTYSESYRNPIRVTYSLYKCSPSDSVARGSTDFYSEQGVTTASSKDFVGNQWDKGHLAPCESFSDTKVHMKLTFSYVNCAVQHFQLNRGLWNRLENQERKWSQKDSLLVTIDVKFDSPVKKLPTGTAIPKEFVRTIKFVKAKKTVIYRFPNSECKGNLDEYLLKR